MRERSFKSLEFGQLVSTVGTTGKQLQTSQYRTAGAIPIVDQGKDLVVGYTDDVSRVVKQVPLTVFGDHTRIVKFIDFEFAVGADGTKLLRPVQENADARYIAYLAEFAVQRMKNLGYSRHFAELRGTVVPYTSDEVEQRVIGKILGHWHNAIETVSRLIAATEKRREYLTRMLMSNSNWPKCPIGDVISAISRPLPTPKTAYKAVSIRSHGKGTFQRTVDRPEEIDMDTVYAVGARDLIVNITFAWEGAIALAKPIDAGCFVSHQFPTFEIDESKIYRDFLGYAVRTRRFFYDLGIASPGGAGRNRVLNKTEFLKIKIPLPSAGIQRNIAEVLNIANHEIELLNSEQDVLEKQKRGLMRKLLSGEWRVPLPEPGSGTPGSRSVVEAAQ